MAQLLRTSIQVRALDLTGEAIGKRLHIAAAGSIGVSVERRTVTVVGIVEDLLLNAQWVGIRFAGITPGQGPFPEIMPGFFILRAEDTVELDTTIYTEETD